MRQVVEREVYVEARPDLVWNAITQPEHLGCWYAFGGAEVDLHPGGRLLMRREEHGEYRGFVERIEPGRRFTYRYAVLPGVDPTPDNSNQVELTLTPDGEGTRLTVVESGFDRLDLSEDERIEYERSAAQAWDSGLAALGELAKEL